jgi:hypothetical protein
MIKPWRMRWVGHVASIGEDRRETDTNSDWKTEAKRQLGRSRHRSQDNIKMYLKEMWES